MSIARTLVFLLAFGNLVFFAWTRESPGSPGDSREPDRLAAQVSPEKIRIITANKRDADANAQAPVPEPAADSSVQSTPTSTPGEAKVAAAPAPTPVAEVCREVGELPLDEAEKLKAAIYAGAAAVAVTLRTRTEVQNYWLRIPPLRDRAEAENKAAEIKKLGVSDFYVVQDEGPNLNAISLGLFHSEQAAAELRNRLTKKGVRTMEIQSRGKAEKATLELRGSEELLNKPVAELLTKAGARTTDCKAR
jgi:cell division protein FtsN